MVDWDKEFECLTTLCTNISVMSWQSNFIDGKSFVDKRQTLSNKVIWCLPCYTSNRLSMDKM